MLVTILAYLPSLSGGFLWDDDGHITKPELRTLVGLGRIWSEPGATQQYYPLLHSAFWVEHRFWGDHPIGYRLLNIFLHVASAGLLAALMRRLAIPGAWLAAFLFALHPVYVESVAWITEQKNTLSLVIYLGAALMYLRFHITRRSAHYALATALFFAAILSKTVTATLPAALLVVIAWRFGPLKWRRDLLPLLPWLALGLGSGLFTAWRERTSIGAEGADFSLSLLERCLLAGRIVWFYLGKFFWPAELVFIYPRWTLDAAEAWQSIFPLTLVALFGLLVWWRKRSGAPLTLLLLFVGTLVPALGFVSVYPFLYSYVADHFQYHASLSLAAATAALLSMGLSRMPRWVALVISGALLSILGALTARQSFTYRSNTTLFEATLEKNPACWMAHTNLGLVLIQSGNATKALPHFESAVLLRPDPEEENNLGNALTRLGRAPEAIACLQRAVASRPDFVVAHNNLGIAWMAMKRTHDAIGAFREALRVDPAYPISHFNLGLALAHSGKTTEAITHFQRALALKPDYADPELHWGICLTLLENFTAAIPHYERAITLAPQSAQNRYLYARALESVGRTREALLHYREALALDPSLSEVRQDLARALRSLGES